MNDRRIYDRQESHIGSPVEILVEQEDGVIVPYGASLIDRSNGGFCLATSSHVPVHPGVLLLVIVRPGGSDRSFIENKVVWIRSDADKLIVGCEMRTPPAVLSPRYRMNARTS
jgi:hypothetical protein